MDTENYGSFISIFILSIVDVSSQLRTTCCLFCVLQRPDILEELQKSQKVFAEKLNHLSRRLAWINATIYSKVILNMFVSSAAFNLSDTDVADSVCLVQDKMLDVYWLLCVCIRTIEHADNTGSLFAFAPEFYLNVAMNAYSALKNYFSPANSMEELPGTRFLHVDVLCLYGSPEQTN